MIEHFFYCPYCVSIVKTKLDPETSGQDSIEDCEICYNPIELRYNIQANELIGFEAASIEQ